MKKIIIEAGQLPELQPPIIFKDRVLKALKEAKDGLTNHEICIKLSIKERRRVSEKVAEMKDEGKVSEKRCRCGHAPIYYIL